MSFEDADPRRLWLIRGICHNAVVHDPTSNLVRVDSHTEAREAPKDGLVSREHVTTGLFPLLDEMVEPRQRHVYCGVCSCMEKPAIALPAMLIPWEHGRNDEDDNMNIKPTSDTEQA